MHRHNFFTVVFIFSFINFHTFLFRWWLNLILNATISQVHSLLLSIFWSVFIFFSVEAKNNALISWQLPFCIRESYCLIGSHCEFKTFLNTIKTVRKVKYKIKMINEKKKNSQHWNGPLAKKKETKTITKNKWN